MGLFSRKPRPQPSQQQLGEWLVESVKDRDYAEVESLIARGVNPSLPEEEGPLYHAVKREDEKMVKLLLEKGANPNVQAGEEKTLFMMALSTWRSGLIEAFIEKADPNFKAKNGATPLIHAINYDSERRTLIMMEKGADPFAADPDGTLPIHAAARKNRQEVLDKLLARGVNIDAKDKSGKTSLHIAAEANLPGVALYLLDKGADPTIVDNAGNTPAHYAQAHNKPLATLLKGVIPGGRGVPEGWKLLAEDEVARVTNKAEIGFRVTEIFNFSARTYTQVLRSFDTGAESQAVKSFDAVSAGTLVKDAYEQLQRLGGRGDYQGLDKKKLQQPGGAL